MNSLRGHKWVIHLWRPQNMTNFVTLHPPPSAKINDRPKRICTIMTNFKTLLSPLRADVLKMRWCQWWWWWLVFAECLTDERRLVLFRSEKIVGAPHNHKSPTCHIWFPSMVRKLFCKILTQNDWHPSSWHLTWNWNPQIHSAFILKF